MKALFVTNEALSADLAWQLKKEGNEVRFYCHDQPEKDVGNGFFEKVDEWEPSKDWADVVIFDDIGMGSKAEQLRKEGKAVVGGGTYTDKLELDREFGQEELKQAGVNTLPRWNFNSFDQAIEFVKTNPDRYVIKPSGKAQNEKELLFIGQEEDGKDVLQILEHYKKAWANKIKEFLVQKFVEGVEIAVGAFFNGKDFVLPINVNFEHKRLFPYELGPSTGEMGCYDEQTEVLTDKGWKFFRNLDYRDSICTLDPASGLIEFHQPTALVSFSHHRRLVSIQNRTLDIMVTPDHNMFVESQQNARKHRNAFGFVKARNLQAQSVIKRTGVWTGREVSVFVLPSVTVGHYEGRQVVLNETPPLQILMDTWLAFLGIWLSDGSVSSNRGTYRISVAQKAPSRKAAVESLLSSLPFRFEKNDSDFYCYDKQLGSYLSEFGKAPEKFVPEYVKELSARQIRIFMDWFAFGDGTMMRNGYRIFYTSSKRLADDLQELLLRVGRVGTLKPRRRGGRVKIGRHEADAPRSQYEVHERVKKLESWIDRRDIKYVPYEGRVYCAEVRNHVMYVRRNGKPYWCGNTFMWWTRSSPVFESTLLKTKDRLASSGYVGYIDINCIVNARGIWPLEWTCFDTETEILTREGWKTYDAVKVGDAALSINPQNREISWKRITNKFVKDYRGKMVRIGAKGKKHSAIDILVTPEHKLLVSTSGRLRMVRADSIPIHETKIIRTGTFKGDFREDIVVPEYVREHSARNGTVLQTVLPAVSVRTEAFMKFLGIFLAEGYSTGDFVKIYQSRSNPNREIIQEILDEFPFRYTVQDDGFQVSSVQLCSFLKALGLEGVHAESKFVPSEFKELTPRQLEALVYGFALGDGHRHKRTKQLYLLSSSKRLADDLQEIVTKIGIVANMRVQKQAGTLSIGGYLRKNDIYVLSLRNIKKDYYLDSRVVGEEQYDGIVWDVEVQDWHTMLVRRHGKPFFSENCRFGYPTISIQMEGITSDWGTFLYDLAQGKDAQLKAKKGYQVGVVVAIPPWPFEDEKAFRKYSEGATILFRRQNLEGIHIGEVKFEEGDWHIAGNSGYALVITGSGPTMSEAIKETYQRVRNAMIPNMFYRTDIGQRWARDSDMLLSWGFL